MSTLQDDLSQARMELKAAGIKNGDLKKALDEITLQLKKRVRFAIYKIVCILPAFVMF